MREVEAERGWDWVESQGGLADIGMLDWERSDWCIWRRLSAIIAVGGGGR